MESPAPYDLDKLPEVPATAYSYSMHELKDLRMRLVHAMVYMVTLPGHICAGSM